MYGKGTMYVCVNCGQAQINFIDGYFVNCCKKPKLYKKPKMLE